MQRTTVGTMCCDATIDAGAGGCTAWTRGEPWPWHGCAKQPGHGETGGRSIRLEHECKCGVTWGKIALVSANYPDPATGRRPKVRK